MNRAFTQASRFTSKNVNKAYRISLKSNWKVEGRVALGETPNETNRMDFLAKRTFQCPTGISETQTLRFCFLPASEDTTFILNGVRQNWTILEGLATVPITIMIESTNRVELRWRGEALVTPQVPEHFTAWLEILDET